MIGGHLTVADNVMITALSVVIKDIRQPGTYSSGTPLMENGIWHRVCARYKSLDKLAQTVARLDKSSE
jgi:UDP-3-O-[3-hydroxymyristoyl] glucosamine N-acyltransferase